MGMSNGAAGMLGALGLAALAGGLAYGAHMIIPAAEPSVGPGSSSPIAMSDDLCLLMDEMVAYTDAMTASDSGNDILMDESTWEDPATIEAMHAQGQSMIDAIGPLTGYLNRAAELVSDPAVATAFETMARATAAQMEFLGQMALDADTVGDYVAAMFGSVGDAELVALIEEGDAANAITGAYVLETCGRDILGVGSDTDFDTGTDDNPGEEAVKSDATWLGELMEGYYSDWEEGDPQAEFVASGDGYEFDGGFVGWSDDGVEITGQYANGPDDWCVEVTSVDDPEWPWTYSAQSGLAQGTCS